jgi:transcriptional regulator GlxA family with amidase domain
MRGELSVKEIATATGFKSSHHFSRVFRQVDGLTPTLFRETILTKRK